MKSYEIKVCPFRESGHVEEYHEVFYNLRDNEVIFYGFKLNRKKYFTLESVKVKLQQLLKEVFEDNEKKRLTEVMGVDSPIIAGGNVIRSQLASHFSGRSLEAAGEFSDLYKLGKLIFGIERV